MHLIVHIGMPKTGSTSIQSALSASYDFLLKNGILYPKVNIQKKNHNQFSMYARSDKSMPRFFQSKFKGRMDDIWQQLDLDYSFVERQIKRHKPKIVVLSGENLFLASNAVDAIRLKQKLLGLCRSIQIVAYVRKPSEHYLSVVQQRLKHSSTLQPPLPANFRLHLEAWGKLVGVTPEVRLFERESLEGGDVVQDFMQHFLNIDISETKIAGAFRNESLMPESIEIIQDFRRVNYPDQDDIILESSNLLRKKLESIEASLNLLRKPKLNKEIADYIDYSSTDLIWLKESYGLQFNNINYDKINSNDFNPFSQLKKFSEICQVDQNIKASIFMQAMDLMIRNSFDYRVPNNGYQNFFKRLLR
jgi:hypothetical protein